MDNPIIKLKLAVVGSRSFKNKQLLFDKLDKGKHKIECIITGGAIGVDSFAAEWVKERGGKLIIYYPEWKDENGTFNKGAGFKRNYKIIGESDKALIIWDGKSAGTKHDIEICEKSNKPYKIIYFNPETQEEIKQDAKQ